MVILGLAALVAVGLVPSPALAVDCNEEQGLFVRTYETGADGVWSEIYLRDRDLSLACLGGLHERASEAHSTAHVKNTSFDKWAEVGWHEGFGATSNVHLWNLFWEVGYGNVIICDLSCGPSVACCTWVGFKVASVANSTNWKFWADYGANGGFVQLGPSDGQNATFDHGVPMGETARHGGVGTGASDDHRQLQWKPCTNCSYGFWTSQVTYSKSTGFNWHRTYVNVHHYLVEKD